MSTTRITIKIKDDILNLVKQEAKEQGMATSHLAGNIIEIHYAAEEIPTESKYVEYESKIISLESEVRELKRDKTWLQGEISKLNDGLICQLPAPKRRIKWPWSK